MGAGQEGQADSGGVAATQHRNLVDGEYREGNPYGLELPKGLKGHPDPPFPLSCQLPTSSSEVAILSPDKCPFVCPLCTRFTLLPTFLLCVELVCRDSLFLWVLTFPCRTGVGGR